MRSLLPAGSSHLEMTKGQTFALTDGTGTVLTLVPVEFFLMTPNSFLSVCGLYLLPVEGRGRFVVTYGMKAEDENDDVEDSWECARTTALGVMPAEGSHPRLLMTMAGFSPPRHETVMPIVMVWDAGKASYVVKEKVFRDDKLYGGRDRGEDAGGVAGEGAVNAARDRFLAAGKLTSQRRDVGHTARCECSGVKLLRYRWERMVPSASLRSPGCMSAGQAPRKVCS